MESNEIKSLGVLICTYQRVTNLERCLQALARQTRPPDDILIVVRDADHRTREYLDAQPHPELPIRFALVKEPGVIAARNVGLARCRTDVLGIIDDDTEPWPDWSERVFAHFAQNPELGGLGGRDRCNFGAGFDDRKEKTVGRLQWFGRPIGNHHLGFGAPRPVDFLKGANMSYRARAFQGVRADTRLRGTGAQPHEDSCFSLAIHRAGWKLLYDPAVGVNHNEGHRLEPRHYAHFMPIGDANEFRDVSYNWAVLFWQEANAPRLAAYLLFSFFVGTRVCPGVVQAIRFLPTLGVVSIQRFWLAQQGTWQAYRAMLKADRMKKAERRVDLGTEVAPSD